MIVAYILVIATYIGVAVLITALGTIMGVRGLVFDSAVRTALRVPFEAAMLGAAAFTWGLGKVMPCSRC